MLLLVLMLVLLSSRARLDHGERTARATTVAGARCSGTMRIASCPSWTCEPLPNTAGMAAGTCSACGNGKAKATGKDARGERSASRWRWPKVEE